MKLLILGGTVFLGRHLVEAALAAGHEVTLFNRGRTGPELYPEVERLVGDRDGALDALGGRTWDTVVDTCGYVPRVVSQSAALLADHVGLYVFISSGSVYPHPVTAGTDEDGALVAVDAIDGEEVTGESYGPLKLLCERAVQQCFGDRSLIVRSGLIVGRHDPSDRFTYWPLRVARGGRILAPIAPDRPVQIVDARDQAEWIVRMAEGGRGGVFNVTGPTEPLSFGQLLATCGDVAGTTPELVWADAEFLDEHGVELWAGLPLSVGDDALGFMQVSIRRALDAGLTFRPLEDTVRDTLEWAQSRDPQVPLRAGIDAAKESVVLAAWD